VRSYRRVAFRYHTRRDDFVALWAGPFDCTGGFGLGCGASQPAEFWDGRCPLWSSLQRTSWISAGVRSLRLLFG
jgi:hypothetical protein